MTQVGLRRGAVGAVVLAAAVLAAGAGTAGAEVAPGGGDSGEVSVRLPEPTGAHPVGSTGLHLVDEGRADIWNPDAEARELLVTLWYPARAAVGERAPYVTEAESAATIAAVGLDLPADTLARVGTHSYTDAPVRRTPGGSPLVVLSPGAGFSRTTLTVLAEDLASRGFVVAGVDHAYEAGPVEFPGGRMLDCAACAQDRWAEGTLNRAADIGFVIDELTGPGSAWHGSRAIDADRIGVAGHSAGGSAAAELLRSDERVDAAVNLDGPYYSPALDEGTDRPLALLSSDLAPPPFHDSQAGMWPRLTGWREWLRPAGSGHSNAIDRGVLIDRLGVREQVDPAYMRNQFGSLPTEYGQAMVRDYVTGFFTQHLRGVPQPIIEDPASVYPELVRVEQP
ncbi:alpha/beta hydrolase family protein [Allonocardiopsis opalescens]|uniref:Platelet-activating factor acetylhydrolase isoform II n=1 Tax=Allonocardiopsis opalescens TaxID=1144618 RepID=A0A2T0Q1Y8_9ACTN|nr:acetylhydrolase [Allonocardiopsis opalescens]PRX97814.1 platelet-activating factor acetylhydrolase isoform II [Allonocardiopsis opalescens]